MCLSFPHPLLVWSGHVESTGGIIDSIHYFRTRSQPDPKHKKYSITELHPGRPSSAFASVFKKNLNASKPSEHPPQVEECLKV